MKRGVTRKDMTPEELEYTRAYAREWARRKRHSNLEDARKRDREKRIRKRPELAERYRRMDEAHAVAMETGRVPLLARDGSIRGWVVVDASDFDRLMEQHWCMDGNGYARGHGKTPAGERCMVAMHRFILGLDYDDPREVDHINRNPLDNRRCNLRLATRALNCQNLTPIKGKTSIHRGVHRLAEGGRYWAYGEVDGRRHNLGRFATEEEAARAASEWRARNMPFSEEAAG